MEPKLCRLCNQELTELWWVVEDPGDIFYYCECGATNQLRRPPGKKKPRYANEWTRNAGNVSIEQVPLREFHGGYHVERRQPEPIEEMSYV